MNRRNFGGASLVVMLSGMGAHRVAQAAIPPGYVNVKAFGAKGDGQADDSAAVQRAMQAGAAVWFPAGIYIVGNLKLKDGQTLAGEGRGSVLRQRIGSAYCVSANPGGEGYADPALNLSGISVLDCIGICEKIMGNRVMEEGLQRVGRSISEGQGISQAFLATKLFPPLVLRMLRVGESTGALDTALLNVSYFYNRQVREGIAKMQTLLGPLTTVILGVLIVGILYSIFLPIYDVIGKIKF